MKIVLFGMALMLVSLKSFGSVRTVEMNEKSMIPIYLQMGKSTVIHFVTDKAKKIIAGNLNYFNIEFTGNDVTIQPLGEVASNLFVYGELHRYGFLLKVNQLGMYDDLVNIRWKNNSFLEKKQEPKQRPETRHTEEKNKIGLDSFLDVSSIKLVKDPNRDLYLIDFNIQNISTSGLKLTKSNFKLTRNEKIIPTEEIIFMKEKLDPSEATKGRVIFKLNDKKAFSFWVELNGKRNRIIIPEKALL